MFSSGERFFVLQKKATGEPLFEPTLFVTNVARANGLASATIKQVLTSIMVLQLALDDMRIDLEERLSEGRLLGLNEVEAIIGYCRSGVARIVDTLPLKHEGLAPKVISLEKARMRSGAAQETGLVDAQTTGVRVRYLRDYLDWLAKKRELKLGPAHPQFAGLSSIRELIYQAFTERVPKVFAKDEEEQRQGLSEEAMAQLRAVIEPSASNNPWKGEAIKLRNQLMVEYLISLGFRVGELLGIRISNISFQANEVTIKRQADEADDPRTRQPNTKTRSRTVPASDDLMSKTQHYITRVRSRQGTARKHDWLFVSNGAGKPLSLSAVNKIFDDIRAACPDLLADLTPHVLRHSWNDAFTALMDERKVSEEQEIKMRNELMGWSPKSKTAATYTRRVTRKKAKEAGRALQNALTGPVKK
jgi:integrase